MDWSLAETSIPGKKYVRNRPLVDKDKVKLGLIKNFVKAKDKHGKGFGYLREKFPKLSDATLKADISVGPQIRVIINNDLSEHLLKTENSERLTFRMVCANLIENVKADNYKGTC